MDAYRHQAAEIRAADGDVGTIYVQPELVARSLGGYLWWRKWERAREHVILWIDLPETGPTDSWIEADDLDEELDHWERAEFDYVGETYGLAWLGDERSRQMSLQLGIDESKDA